MRAVVQRVTRAQVAVGGEIVAGIGFGVLVYLGIAAGDSAVQAAWMTQHIAELRLFPVNSPEGAARMERSLIEAGGAALVVPQFTLLADTSRGHRPSFFGAAPAHVAEPLVAAVTAGLFARGIEVATGRFGSHMLVDSENDGPVTIVLDTLD